MARVSCRKTRTQQTASRCLIISSAPYPGYNNIAWTDNAYTSNYNALLVSLNRRFSKGFQFGLSYTHSKYMDYTGIPIYAPLRTWSYGFDSADQTHNVTINYVWDLPRASKLKNNALIRNAFDGWSLSGVSQFVSGTPQAISFSTVQGTDLTGGGDGQRVNVVGNASSCCKTLLEWFNPAAFAVPGMNDPGNAGKYNVRGPGVDNYDMALAKRFPITGENGRCSSAGKPTTSSTTRSFPASMWRRNTISRQALRRTPCSAR